MSEKKFNPADHLIQLKDRDYLQVMWRLVWFREEHPAWSIETEPIALDEKAAAFRAYIKDETGRTIQTGYGSETIRDFGDYAEKAETKAVGRALAMLGYGTQFTALELDETEGKKCPRMVDSPVNRKPAQSAQEPRRALEAPQTVNNPPKEPERCIGQQDALKLAQELTAANVNLDKLLKQYGVSALQNLTEGQAAKIRNQLQAAAKKEEPQHE